MLKGDNLKKGFTIIELVVSMSIFAILSTMAVGAFVAISRSKNFSATMRESQQKIRIATEMISRLTRQADQVEVTGSTIATLYFKNTSPMKVVRFTLNPLPGAGTLNYTECSSTSFIPPSYLSCTAWSGTTTDLLSGKTALQSGSSFTKESATAVPTLKLVLQGNVGTYGPFSDHFDIETRIPLENFK